MTFNQLSQPSLSLSYKNNCEWFPAPLVATVTFVKVWHSYFHSYCHSFVSKTPHSVSIIHKQWTLEYIENEIQTIFIFLLFFGEVWKVPWYSLKTFYILLKNYNNVSKRKSPQYYSITTLRIGWPRSGNSHRNYLSDHRSFICIYAGKVEVEAEDNKSNHAYHIRYALCFRSINLASFNQWYGEYSG